MHFKICVKSYHLHFLCGGIICTTDKLVSNCWMFIGSDSARKVLKQGGAVKAWSSSKEVEDELASMRGTKDTDGIAYLERKPIHGICHVEEEPRIDARLAGNDDSAEMSTARISRDSSPAPSRHPTTRHTVKSSDKGIS